MLFYCIEMAGYMPVDLLAEKPSDDELGRVWEEERAKFRDEMTFDIKDPPDHPLKHQLWVEHFKGRLNKNQLTFKCKLVSGPCNLAVHADRFERYHGDKVACDQHFEGKDGGRGCTGGGTEDRVVCCDCEDGSKD